MSLFFVFLRRPHDLADRRSDPFWEFGSFGATGCHHKNLLNPNSRHLNRGDRLAFLQGGDGEIRVVGVTPEIAEVKVRQPIEHGRVLLEVRWDSSYRSLPYGEAPLLVSNHGILGAFPEVYSMLTNVNRSSIVAKAASKFRTRTEPLPNQLSTAILKWFSRPGLPKVERYIDSVAPAITAWHQNADTNQWWLRSQRMQRYGDCIGVSSEGLSAEYALVISDAPLVRKQKTPRRR